MGSRSYRIDSATEYNRVKKAISKKDQPSKIMRFLMNSLESYRQSKKLGWSRSWNKYNLTVFQSFKLRINEDRRLLELAKQLLDQDIAMPSSAKNFVEQLLADEKHLMGFIFVHDFNDNGQQFEGATLSLGRVKDKKFRDRIDLIFESPVENESTLGFSRIRVYIDPYMGAKELLWTCTVSDKLSPHAFELFESLSTCSWDWAEKQERVWQHWTSNYIDYFGYRSKPLNMSYFYQAGKPESRVRNKEERAA